MNTRAIKQAKNGANLEKSELRHRYWERHLSTESSHSWNQAYLWRFPLCEPINSLSVEASLTGFSFACYWNCLRCTTVLGSQRTLPSSPPNSDDGKEPARGEVRNSGSATNLPHLSPQTLPLALGHIMSTCFSFLDDKWGTTIAPTSWDC